MPLFREEEITPGLAVRPQSLGVTIRCEGDVEGELDLLDVKGPRTREAVTTELSRADVDRLIAVLEESRS